MWVYLSPMLPAPRSYPDSVITCPSSDGVWVFKILASAPQRHSEHWQQLQAFLPHYIPSSCGYIDETSYPSTLSSCTYPPSGEGLPGALPGGVGQEPGPRGGAEEAARQALRGGPAAAGPQHARQEEHHHCLRPGTCRRYALVQTCTAGRLDQLLFGPPLYEYNNINDIDDICCPRANRWMDRYIVLLVVDTYVPFQRGVLRLVLFPS